MNATASLIELPETLEVCLYNFADNVYGGVDRYKHNRIGINYKLELYDIPEIVVHELIHVHQRYKRKLEIKNGTYYWYGIPYSNKLPEEMTYFDYKETPWEIDVENKLDKLLDQVLEIVNMKT